MPDVGTELLRGRYTLARRVAPDDSSEGRSADWIALGPFESQYLVRLWSYDGDTPDQLKRALWDYELRTLYRVSSSPGAEDMLVTLKDAGVDREAHTFVMALQAPGYDRLSAHLPQRSKIPWLTGGDSKTRVQLWQAFRKIATGIELLHDQQVVHRDVSLENIYFSPQEGVTSLRLGGFEWSVRLGRPAEAGPSPGWASPPELFAEDATGYQPDFDWFGFGMIVARCLLDLERYKANEPMARYKRTIDHVSKATRDLNEKERELILRLLMQDPLERAQRSYEIFAAIDDIITALKSAFSGQLAPHLLAINPRDDVLVDAALEAGYKPDEGQASSEEWNPNSLIHVSRLKSFLQQDLVGATIYEIPNSPRYLLVGKRLRLAISAFSELQPDGQSSESWDVAFCQFTSELRGSEPSNTNLGERDVWVKTVSEVHRERSVRQQTESWETSLPKAGKADRLRANLERFHYFVRCTNQIELLIRDSEIFQYKIVERSEQGTVERIEIEEVDRKRPPMFPVPNGMVEHLLAEKESGKEHCQRIVLTDLRGDSLLLPPIQPSNQWEIESGDIDARRLVLIRTKASLKKDLAPDAGFVRAWGMFGQVSLIRRRKAAVDRLSSHSYLLRALVSPGQTYMDTGASELPYPLSADLDPSKHACIADILRVRPIYALQGPPGTGKTTMVAWLLREIFEEDPVGQVLVTAPAHQAVEVLRRKVREEAFADVEPRRQPLAVRLRARSEDAVTLEGSVEYESQRLLESTNEDLTSIASRTPLQEEWLAAVREMISALKTRSAAAEVGDFCELVKRAASITYCTTSAGELEALSLSSQSFDWSILEEAGKAHGFDLALPLQAGHRWLLIGDQNQLKPYRDDSYSKGLRQLELVAQALWDLPERAGGLVDQEWLKWWNTCEDEDREEFKEYARQWLFTFERIYARCETAPGGDKQRTLDSQANASAAGMLHRQHRMHPVIGDLISNVFYGGEIINETVTPSGEPRDEFLHGLTVPQEIEGKAIVWLNTPWVQDDVDARFSERGNRGYRNPGEAAALANLLSQLDSSGPKRKLSLAVLSPYAQQVQELRSRLRGVQLPGFITPKGRGADVADESGSIDPVHTVDSFQGSEADIVAVSLVRNNAMNPGGKGLGFLDDWRRVNVLLSRAERLLIIVGSWDFFEHQVSLIVDPTDRSDDLRYWHMVLSTIQASFHSGHAIRLDARSFV